MLSEAVEVYSFGYGNHGQLGHGDTAWQFAPRVVAGLQGVRVGSVAAGDRTSFAATADGEAYGWGCGVDDGEEEEEDTEEEEDREPDPVLGLEVTEHQLVPVKYPWLRLHA